MILDVVCCFLLLFLLYINIEIGKKMLIIRLADDNLYEKLLFTWPSLVMSLMCHFVLSLFLRDVLDEILDLIESVSEGFPTYSCSLVVIVLHLMREISKDVSLVFPKLNICLSVDLDIF